MSNCTVSSHCRHKCDRRKCEGFEAGAAWSRGIFGWSRSRHFGPAPAPPSVCACKNRFIKIISPTPVKKTTQFADGHYCVTRIKHIQHIQYTLYIHVLRVILDILLIVIQILKLCSQEPFDVSFFFFSQLILILI